MIDGMKIVRSKETWPRDVYASQTVVVCSDRVADVQKRPGYWLKVYNQVNGTKLPVIVHENLRPEQVVKCWYVD